MNMVSVNVSLHQPLVNLFRFLLRLYKPSQTSRVEEEKKKEPTK
jgi:hypothetical protein